MSFFFVIHLYELTSLRRILRSKTAQRARRVKPTTRRVVGSQCERGQCPKPDRWFESNWGKPLMLKTNFRFPQKLRFLIYFCTAENADLKKRLDTSMGEVLELDKENKDLKEHKVKTSIALTLLDRLKQEHPEIYREVISQKKKPTTREKKNWWTK